jgi:hypothetical protein
VSTLTLTVTDEPVAGRSWLRQLATKHGVDPSLKPPPEVVFNAFLGKPTEWHSAELGKRRGR